MEIILEYHLFHVIHFKVYIAVCEMLQLSCMSNLLMFIVRLGMYYKLE
jgi:hypothetical protein